MARRVRRQPPGGHIDLFAFLSIMAATIGVQTLLIVVCALQIKPGAQAVQFLPAGGEGRGKVAHFILCNGNGQLELINAQGRVSLNRRDPRLDAFLKRIAAARFSDYLVIGVRPNGYRDFEVIRSKAEALRITLGYEPLEAGLKVTMPDPQLLQRS
jgi:hypothetical protein